MSSLLRYTILLLFARGNYLGTDGWRSGGLCYGFTKVAPEGCIDGVCVYLDVEIQCDMISFRLPNTFLCTMALLQLLTDHLISQGSTDVNL